MRRPQVGWVPFTAPAPAVFLLAVDGICVAISEISGHGVGLAAVLAPFIATLALGVLAPMVNVSTDHENAAAWAAISVVLTCVALVTGFILGLVAIRCSGTCG